MSVSYYAAGFGLVPLAIFGKAPFNAIMKRFSTPTAPSSSAAMPTVR
jgi:hypothetical protein